MVYRKEGLFVFVISQQRKWYYLLYKRYQQEGQPFVCRKANRLGTEKDLPMLSLATLVASYRYLYVGFGIYADENASSSIYRLALRESFVD